MDGFFAYYAESLQNEVGTIYVEIRDDLVQRQIWEFGTALYWATAISHKDQEHGFTDQPEWHAGEGTIDLRSINCEVFEALWHRADGPVAPNI